MNMNMRGVKKSVLLRLRLINQGIQGEWINSQPHNQTSPKSSFNPMALLRKHLKQRINPNLLNQLLIFPIKI